jgi:hypothetical protein
VKKIILLLILSLSIESIKCNELELISSIFDSVCIELGIDNVQIKIKELSFNSKINDNPAASCQKIKAQKYSIYFYHNMERDCFIKAILHEFIHIQQFESGRLIVKSNYIFFDNIIITKDLAWEKRPFEAEAIKKSNDLFNKYFK